MLFLLSNYFILKASFLPYLWSFDCLHIYYTYFVWIVKSQNKKDAIDASSFLTSFWPFTAVIHFMSFILAFYSAYLFLSYSYTDSITTLLRASQVHLLRLVHSKSSLSFSVSFS